MISYAFQLTLILKPGIIYDIPSMPESQKTQLDIDYDTRQLKLMLQKISTFKQGDLYLIYLIEDLEGLLNALVNPDQNWKDTFMSYWWDLEQVYAVAVSEERNLDSEDVKIITEALEYLENMIQVKLKKIDLSMTGICI